MDRMMEILEFNRILNMLKEHAACDLAKEKIEKLEPFLSEEEVLRHIQETTEGRKIIEQCGTPPLSPMHELKKMLSQLGKGVYFTPEQLENIAQFFTACRRLKSYLEKAEQTSTSVSLYGRSIHDLSDIEDEIRRDIRGNQVDDKASSLLANLRRKLDNAGNQIKSKLNSLLRNNGSWFSESYVSIRNGCYTLPVKSEFKSKVKGTVVDISQSGNTFFIEPDSARKWQDEISILRIEEENEVRRILYKITAYIEENVPLINMNIEAMESLDFIFAKAKLSIAMKAVAPRISTERKIVIRSGRHPLLQSDEVIPLDFHIDSNARGMVITGPNTGGKTVVLKTIGLFSLMAQSGLHIPAKEGSFTMNHHVLCDIGDGQSITENLSTFSAHITRIIEILKLADEQSLVLLDELGSGTDPAEGMGLAIAILEELSAKNCLFIATSHYPEVKDFAGSAPGMLNARMAFDRGTLKPLYKLEIGEAGESCALYIAKRLGLPQQMIERANKAAYGHQPLDISCLYTETPQPDEKILSKPSARRIKEKKPRKSTATKAGTQFHVGDSVLVYPEKHTGIVYREVNSKGEVIVQVKKRKMAVNHTRLKLQVPASELYPENYDFSIIFDSVENRKARHTLNRKHDPSAVVKLDDID